MNKIRFKNRFIKVAVWVKIYGFYEVDKEITIIIGPAMHMRRKGILMLVDGIFLLGNISRNKAEFDFWNVTKWPSIISWRICSVCS